MSIQTRRTIELDFVNRIKQRLGRVEQRSTLEMKRPFPSRNYPFVRGRELEGTYPGPPNMGVWLVTAQRVSKGWGRVPEAAWPYGPEEWPPAEPPGIDEVAKGERTTSYTRCRSLDDCRSVLVNGGGVLAAFQIDASWLGSDGNIADPRKHVPETTHSLLLFGHSDRTETFRFVNNWGSTWGDGGYGNLPYRYWTDRLLEAWIPDNRTIDPLMLVVHSGIDVMVTHAEDWHGQQIHLIEVRNFDDDDILGWAILVEAVDGLELEEFFVRPAFRHMGYGRKLATTIDGLRNHLQLPLKAWIPHADWPGSSAQDAVLRRLGLNPAPTPERWAASCAVEAPGH